MPHWLLNVRSDYLDIINRASRISDPSAHVPVSTRVFAAGGSERLMKV